ncbi:MAG: GlyGly-CTERM sorting domain-containing protein, partial [Phycisphaerae bacterium]|nr:GlyGly-CTERM sorting domain-containing protein [Phycisphaerae bacterium]
YTGTDSCVVRLTDGDGDADDGTFSYTINATGGGGGGGGGSGISLPGGSGAVDPWSLLLLGGLPLLRRRRD